MMHIGVDIGEASRSLKRLHENNFDDSDLPIDKWEEILNKMWERKRFLQHSDFYEKQWRFIAPVFSQKQYHYDLQDHAIFSFIKKLEESAREGTFSRVYRFQIHKAHQHHSCTDVRTLPFH